MNDSPAVELRMAFSSSGVGSLRSRRTSGVCSVVLPDSDVEKSSVNFAFNCFRSPSGLVLALFVVLGDGSPAAVAVRLRLWLPEIIAVIEKYAD